MPGKPSIVWNDANDARLLRAFLTADNAPPTEAFLQKIVELMGPCSPTCYYQILKSNARRLDCGVTSAAIKHRIYTHRRQGRGGTSMGTPGTPNRVTKTTSRTPKKATPSKPIPRSTPKKAAVKPKKEIDTDDEEIIDNAEDCMPKTPSATSVRVRRSMSKTPKVNYAQLDDPHAEDILDEVIDLKRKLDDETESEQEDTFKAPELAENDDELDDAF